MLPTTRDDAKTDQDLTFENTAHRRIYAWTKTPILDVSTNNGLHMHGIILANRWGRLTDPGVGCASVTPGLASSWASAGRLVN